MADDKRFALLIDAENISHKYVRVILDELAAFGVVTYRRIYGDWTSTNTKAWKDVLLEYSITPIQQYSYTSGKNASDSAMIIDAMDILYSKSVDGFVLVSSDSDFTRLASRLRESAMNVIGMGESKTPQAFISACNIFKYLDILYQNEHEEEHKTTTPVKKTRTVRKPQELQPQTKIGTIRRGIRSIIEENSAEDGWVSSADLGNQLAKRFPDFDVRNYGHKKFTIFVQSLEGFDVKKVGAEDGSGNYIVYFKNKE